MIIEEVVGVVEANMAVVVEAVADMETEGGEVADMAGADREEVEAGARMVAEDVVDRIYPVLNPFCRTLSSPRSLKDSNSIYIPWNAWMPKATSWRAGTDANFSLIVAFGISC